MGYVIAGILVVVIVAVAVAVAVRRATERRGQASIAAPDSNTPLGDTDQHAGEQNGRGETVADPEDDRPVTPESERLANRDR
jgi:hypothetical protein